MSPTIEVLLSVLVVAGAAFTFIGSLGLVRLPDFYTRLHGPTKATTLGVGCLLVASSVAFSAVEDGLSLNEVLVSVFLFITAPISAHLLAKAALHLDLPGVATGAGPLHGDGAPAPGPVRPVGQGHHSGQHGYCDKPSATE